MASSPTSRSAPSVSVFGRRVANSATATATPQVIDWDSAPTNKAVIGWD
ncbi:hypothetical protein [Streptomyces sp. AB3(2024)]